MTVTHQFCDVEQLLVGWIPTVVDARALTELPANLQDLPAVVQVVRVGGPTGAPGFDLPLVSVDCFAATRPAAKALAIQVQTALVNKLPGFYNPYGTVLSTETVSGPSWRPYDDTNMRRIGAVYRLVVHSRT